MTYFHPDWIAHQRERWMPPRAQRCLRPAQVWTAPRAKLFGSLQPIESDAIDNEIAERESAERHAELLQIRGELASIKTELKFWCFSNDLKANFNPNQPRVPAGNAGGGQWTGGGGHTDFSASGRRLTGPPKGTPAQQARLQIAEARARDATRRVRELDPNWRPKPSAYETMEGRIAAAQAEAREAQARIAELSRLGIGPGPFSGGSIPGQGPTRNFTAAERREINRIGKETGCHTCGTFDPGTRTGNFVPDHQLPTALNPFGRPQRLYPQCVVCSDFQGGWIRGNRRRR
jgi:hypothetical protein